MRDQGRVRERRRALPRTAPPAFSSSSVYYLAEEIASVSFSLIKKMKVNLPPHPTPYFFIHFFRAKEFLINEPSLCEVAEIHLVVSNLDFYTRRTLMSLHIFMAFVCVGVFFFFLARALAREKIFTLPPVTVCPCGFPGAWRAWPAPGAASGTRRTTPAATWMKPRAPTSLSTGRFVSDIRLISDGTR